MGDILKEAIADAKAVRETALQNAKMALEEAFTPQLKSMLSAKLREEEDDDKEEGRHDEGEHDDDDAEEGRLSAGAHDDEAEEGRHDEGEHEEGMHDEGEDDKEEGRHDKEEGMHDEGEHEEGMHGDDDEEDDLDLEAVIKELEAEINEKEDDDEDAEEGRGMKEEEDLEEEFEIDESLFEEDELDEEEDLEEVDKSSEIGSGTGKGDTDKSSDIGKGDNKLAEIKSELKEYKEAVRFLKDKLHEVNILNAKLLFTNKLFKEYSLDNSQKLKVVETFDRAQTTREIKLVYSTLAESFKTGPITRKTKHINESASSAVGSTKPSKQSRKVITEEQRVADRFRKLAGLIK